MTSPNTTAALVSRAVTGKDAYGNDVYGETVTLLPAIWWPAGSSEAVQGQDQVTWSDTICFPTGTPVAATDVVIPQAQTVNGTVEGDRYAVNGQPAAYPPSPFGGWQPPYSVVVQLKRVTG